MTGKRIIIYILACFVTGNLILVYIQYHSTKNIYSLIDGNEKMLSEFKISNQLRELKRDVVFVRSENRRRNISPDTLSTANRRAKISAVQENIDKLQKISDDDSSVKYVDVLDTLVQRKLTISWERKQYALSKDFDSITNQIMTGTARQLDDSILMVINAINDSRQKHLALLIAGNDESGKKALHSEMIMITLVLLSGAGLFWFIIHTIRRQKQLIEQLDVSAKGLREAVKVKEMFMANMSHEIRTPLNAILGFANLLQRRNLDYQANEFVRTIRKSGEDLLTIVNDVLDLSKMEAGMMRIETAPFDIRALIDSVDAMFQEKADKKQIMLISRVEDSMPKILEGDATRLTQILVNLIGNSLKFIEAGEIQVDISCLSLRDRTVMTGITIKDTGIGIEKDKLNFIFERFRQAEDSATRNYGGTGLGLSIVHELVLLQKGTIEVESEPGAGTVFSLIIPYKLAGNALHAKPKEDHEKNFIPFIANRNILVVEDNLINQTLLKYMLSDWQIGFELAVNGKQALEKLKLMTYDLILLDIQMPEMDGYTTAMEIRNSLKLDTPIIAMTAHAMAGEREKCVSMGMNDYISKPINQEHLQELLVRYLQTIPPESTVQMHEQQKPLGEYNYIDLKYMKEVSNGNTRYEKTVTEQFIEIVPADLDAMERAWQDQDINGLRSLAHNLKTTVAVMGLDKSLYPPLDKIEYHHLTEDAFQQIFHHLKFVSLEAVKEAGCFYRSI
ncbi:MAG TPA: response regulator [Puia sp.]